MTICCLSGSLLLDGLHPMEGLVSSKYFSNGIYLDSSMRVREFR